MVTMVQADWKWSDDSNEFNIDKQAHFIGSIGLYFMFRHKEFSKLNSIKYTFYCGLGKEVLDVYIPKYKTGKSGGDGFSKYDLSYNLLGIGIAYGVDKIWNPKKVNIGYKKNQLHLSWKIQ